MSVAWDGNLTDLGFVWILRSLTFYQIVENSDPLCPYDEENL